MIQTTTNIALEVRNIYKRLGEIQALKDITLSFYKGEIHTLLGENGAGKTTLMNIIYGLYTCDAGEIYINGRKQNIDEPRISLKLGIGMVPQVFKLVPDMTIFENVFLFMQKTRFFIEKKDITRKIITLSKLFKFGIEKKLDVEVNDLSEGEKQKVEILKVLARGSDIILFDEATNVLSPNELETFFTVISDLNKQGYTIIYITHRLQEALEISDKISVFRKGELVGTIPGHDATYNKLTIMMVGEEFEGRCISSSIETGKSVLKVSNLSARDDRGILAIRNVTFELFEKEIIGLAGIEGNGSNQLAESIMGLRNIESGEIRFLGKEITHWSSKYRIKKGMTFIPGSDTLVQMFTVMENSILDYPEQNPFSKKGVLNWGEIRKHAKKIVDTYNVQTPSIDLLSSKLSGGNKQRLCLGRKIEANPRLMIACHPTKGLDVSSQYYIYEKFLEMKKDGATILFMGTDLDELYQICDRIMVIYRGEIVGIFEDIKNVKKFDIGFLMMGGSGRDKI